jgi:hypothetical protein
MLFFDTSDGALYLKAALSDGPDEAVEMVRLFSARLAEQAGVVAALMKPLCIP